MNEEVKQRLAAKENWFRALFMLLFGIINYLVQFVIYLVALFQFVTHLITGKPNQHLLSFGQNLSTYSYQIMQFLTYNRQEKPYPFAEWPQTTSQPNTLTAPND